MSSKQQPIVYTTIIKRKKVVKADGHHGGAWKVAYADFVTAMMAFFLLMWLLNATTEEQRKGIADYFNPTIPISRISGGGSDGLNGSSIFTEETYAKMGTGASRSKSIDSHGTKDKTDERAIAAQLEDLKKGLTEDGHQISEHMLIKMSPEGIVVEITDSAKTPLFPVGSSHPSDRANTARRLLVRSGMPADRIREVSGKAASAPLIPEDPAAPQNRRISITILTQ